jgi:nucleotide-binding universal stress UspA family protein
MTSEQSKGPISDKHGGAQQADDHEPRGPVVVGVDGSDGSSRALHFAADEARLRDCSLRVVRAWHMPPLAYQAYIPPNAYDGDMEAAAAIDEQVEAVLGSCELPTEKVVCEGPAAGVLLDAAKGAELLVVGSRGHGGFAGLLLGSVSNQVVHHAHCPVVVVRP